MERVTFEQLKDKINVSQNFWLIGERKWTLGKNNEIIEIHKINGKSAKLQSHQNGKKFNRAFQGEATQKTGIFLTEKISNLDDFKNCTRLIFFNDKEQYQFVAVDKKCAEFVYHHSEIVGIKTKLKNVEPKESNQKDNFRFTFAQNLGAIHTLNKGNKIYAIVNKETGEWRLGHE